MSLGKRKSNVPFGEREFSRHVGDIGTDGNGATTVLELPKPSRKAIKPPEEKRETVKISPPKMRTVKIPIEGTAPYLQCRFSQKAMNQMMAKQQAGDKEASGKRPRRAPRDYDADYQGSMHKFPDGTCGIPANAFRAAAISACRLVGFKMTMAKLSVFIVADGYDVVDAMPLIKIVGKPEKHIMPGSNSDGSRDIRVRAMFKKWSAVLTVSYDEEQFNLVDIVNLFARVGAQVGIGEGRPDSKASVGMGYGTFAVKA